ncbi:MAG: MerR family DNA-binding protein [Thiothrix sp.]|nr:MerR family DNA-binding protein [Thiothrix sp.]HPQ97429.1 MerR family DNA-binding protein [Thiolinea sp.]
MLTVSELAEAGNTSVHTVRYYLREGLISPSAQGDNHYRLFGMADVVRLRFIRSAKLLGFTLADIRQILEHAELGESPCADVRSIIQQRMQDIEARIREMQQLHARMAVALEKWEAMPDRTPDGNSICHLIESMNQGG